MMESYHGIVLTSIDAVILIEAARQNIIPKVTRRLSDFERATCIKHGSVFIWDTSNTSMQRWTDGRSWSASRVNGSFLNYKELESSKSLKSSSKPNGLIKQTFSMTLKTGVKLHLINYINSEYMQSYYKSATNAMDSYLQRPSLDPIFVNFKFDTELYPQGILNEDYRKANNSSFNSTTFILDPIPIASPVLEQPIITSPPLSQASIITISPPLPNPISIKAPLPEPISIKSPLQITSPIRHHHHNGPDLSYYPKPVFCSTESVKRRMSDNDDDNYSKINKKSKTDAVSSSYRGIHDNSDSPPVVRDQRNRPKAHPIKLPPIDQIPYSSPLYQRSPSLHSLGGIQHSPQPYENYKYLRSQNYHHNPATFSPNVPTAANTIPYTNHYFFPSMANTSPYLFNQNLPRHLPPLISPKLTPLPRF